MNAPRPRGPGLGPPPRQGGKGKGRRDMAGPCGGFVPAVALSLWWFGPRDGLVPGMPHLGFWAEGEKASSCPKNLPTIICRKGQTQQETLKAPRERGRLEVQLQGGCGHPPLPSLAPGPPLLWTTVQLGWDSEGMSMVWHCHARAFPAASTPRREQGSGQKQFLEAQCWEGAVFTTPLTLPPLSHAGHPGCLRARAPLQRGTGHPPAVRAQGAHQSKARGTRRPSGVPWRGGSPKPR